MAALVNVINLLFSLYGSGANLYRAKVVVKWPVRFSWSSRDHHL